MCPMTEDMRTKIIAECKKSANAAEGVIIHIQGDVPGVNQWVGNTCLTPRAGVFPNAFNLFTGGVDFMRFRNDLNTLGAKIFSAAPHIKPEAWSQMTNVIPEGVTADAWESGLRRFMEAKLYERRGGAGPGYGKTYAK